MTSKKLDVTIHVYSAEWKKFAEKLASRTNVVINNAIYQSDYREIINKSKIMLGFITKSNVDEISYRSFEITACGSFLLSERTRFQKKFFREDKEAVYFSDVDECAAKIDYFLAHPKEREIIEEAGYKRVQKLELYNDYLINRVLDTIF